MTRVQGKQVYIESIPNDLTVSGSLTISGSSVDFSNVGTLVGVTAQVPAGTVSSSEQFSSTSLPFTGSFTGSFTGDGSSLTGISSDVPIGTVSSSLQFDNLSSPFTGSFTGSFSGDGSGLTGLVSVGTISSSEQVDHNLTTNYSASRHFLQSDITEVGTVIVGDVSNILPTGIFSGSAQLPAGIVSGSIQVNFDQLTNLPVGIISGSDQLPAGSISGSIQVDHNQTTNYSSSRHFLQSEITALGVVVSGNILGILPLGIVSGSDQLPIGTVSGSSQIDYFGVSNLPLNIISSSLQFYTLSEPFTGSFTGSFIGDGSGLTGIVSAGTVSESVQIDHNLTTNYSSSRHFLKSDIDLGDLGNVDTAGVQNSYGIVYNSASGNFEVTDIGVGASGSVSDATNVGTDGTGVFKQKSGVILQFKNVSSGSSKVTVIENGDDIDIDVDESQISFNSIADTGGVVSGSSQISYTGIVSVPSGIVSGSIQVDHNTTTNYSASRHFLQSEITEVGTVASGDVTGILPLGSISGSAQLPSGIISGTEQLPAGIISGSAQVDFNGISNVPSLISGSSQVDFLTISNKPTLVSGSSQVSYTGITGVPLNIVSSSAQFSNLSSPFTGSFTGSFTGDGSGLTGLVAPGTVSQSSQIDHNLTTNYSASRHFLQSEITEVGTVTSGDISAIVPTGTVSGSSQISYTGILDIPSGIVSSSTQFSSADDVIFGDVTASNFVGTGSGIWIEFGSLADVNVSGVQHEWGIIYNTGSGMWEPADVGATSESGSISNASNVGVGGVGVFEGRVSSILQFRNISSGSSKIIVTHDDPNNEIDIDVDESQISFSNIADTGGLVSGSSQISYTGIINVPLGIVSGAAQLPLGIVSGSIQVDHNGTTNYSASRHFLQSEITEVGTVTTGNVVDILPSGIVSGSSQLPAGTVSSSVQVDYTAISNVPTGIVSGSSQVSYTGISDVPSGIISGSAQLPSGIVSGSVQIDHNGTTNYSASRHFLQSDITTVGTVTSGDVSTILPLGIISGSSQLPDGTVSSSIQVDYFGLDNLPLNIVSSSDQFVQENLDVDIGTETVAILQTGSYSAGFFDYYASDGTNARAGTVMSTWIGTSITYTDNSTLDIGNTNGVTMSVDILGEEARLRATVDSDNWIIKAYVRGI